MKKLDQNNLVRNRNRLILPTTNARITKTLNVLLTYRKLATRLASFTFYLVLVKLNNVCLILPKLARTVNEKSPMNALIVERMKRQNKDPRKKQNGQRTLVILMYLT